MKKAVIIDGTLRSLGYIREYLENFYGKKTDYYILLWDFEYNYFTEEEIIKLKGSLTKQDLKDSDRLYSPVSLDEIYSTVNKFSNVKFLLKRKKDYQLWADKFSDIPFYTLGQIYSKSLVYDFVDNLDSYNLIVYQTPDRIPVGNLPEAPNYLAKIFTPSYSIENGLPGFEYNTFYTSPKGFREFFFNIEKRYRKLLDNVFFNKPSLFRNHFLFGSLLFNTGVALERSSLNFHFIRKEVVLKNINLNTVDSIDEIKSSYGESFKSNKPQLLIPAAGKGSRFTAKNYTVPKFLLPFKESTILEEIIKNFAPYCDIFLVLQKKHYNSFESLRKIVKKYKVKIKLIDYYTDGAADTVLLFEDLVDSSRPTISHDSDLFLNFDLRHFFNNIKYSKHNFILTHLSDKETNSFVKTRNGVVEQVAEKNPISSTACVGVYHWHKASYLFNSIKAMKANKDKTKGEFYLAPTYNYTVKLFNTTYSFPINSNEFTQLGTPEEYEKNK